MLKLKHCDNTTSAVSLYTNFIVKPCNKTLQATLADTTVYFIQLKRETIQYNSVSYSLGRYTILYKICNIHEYCRHL